MSTDVVFFAQQNRDEWAFRETKTWYNEYCSISKCVYGAGWVLRGYFVEKESVTPAKHVARSLL